MFLVKTSVSIKSKRGLMSPHLLVGDVLGAHEAVHHHGVKLSASRNLDRDRNWCF